MVKAALSGDWTTARTLNRQFFRLMLAHFWEPSPAPVKAVLALLGHGEDRLRLPMVPVTAATRRKLELLLDELGLLLATIATAHHD
jgi:4-hydroxy-tetrahydrodipicolinate synthase